MYGKIIAAVMVVAGLITLTMIGAVFQPLTISQMMFAETPTGAMEKIVVPNWGALIALTGGLLIFGAFNPGSRRLTLAVAVIGKALFIALVLAHGGDAVTGAMPAVALDAVMIALFAIFFFTAPRGPATA